MTLLALAAVGLTLLVVAISAIGVGSNGASYRAAQRQPAAAVQPAKTTGHGVVVKVKKRAVTATPAPRPASQTPAPTAVASPKSSVPQQNGGDGDPDNNGGRDDGDGNI